MIAYLIVLVVLLLVLIVPKTPTPYTTNLCHSPICSSGDYYSCSTGVYKLETDRKFRNHQLILSQKFECIFQDENILYGIVKGMDGTKIYKVIDPGTVNQKVIIKDMPSDPAANPRSGPSNYGGGATPIYDIFVHQGKLFVKDDKQYIICVETGDYIEALSPVTRVVTNQDLIVFVDRDDKLRTYRYKNGFIPIDIYDSSNLSVSKNGYQLSIDSEHIYLMYLNNSGPAIAKFNCKLDHVKYLYLAQISELYPDLDQSEYCCFQVEGSKITMNCSNGAYSYYLEGDASNINYVIFKLIDVTSQRNIVAHTYYKGKYYLAFDNGANMPIFVIDRQGFFTFSMYSNQLSQIIVDRDLYLLSTNGDVSIYPDIGRPTLYAFGSSLQKFSRKYYLLNGVIYKTSDDTDLGFTNVKDFILRDGMIVMIRNEGIYEYDPNNETEIHIPTRLVDFEKLLLVNGSLCVILINNDLVDVASCKIVQKNISSAQYSKGDLVCVSMDNSLIIFS